MNFDLADILFLFKSQSNQKAASNFSASIKKPFTSSFCKQFRD
jgi:hypothetical protein